MPGKKDAEQAERRMVPGRRAEDTIVEEEPISVHEGSYFQHPDGYPGGPAGGRSGRRRSVQLRQFRQVQGVEEDLGPLSHRTAEQSRAELASRNPENHF